MLCKICKNDVVTQTHPFLLKVCLLAHCYGYQIFNAIYVFVHTVTADQNGDLGEQIVLGGDMCLFLNLCKIGHMYCGVNMQLVLEVRAHTYVSCLWVSHLTLEGYSTNVSGIS